MAIAALIPVLAPIFNKIIDKTVPDKDAATKAKSELQSELLAHSAEMDKAAASIVLAEANSNKTLTSQWRPILMLSITAILVNNFLLAPYAQAIFGASVVIEMPDSLWQLLNIGVGGYVVGRSGEKIAASLTK